MGTASAIASLPRTRYQGSKRKLCGWIAECLAGRNFESVLDAFGGTGSVAYMFKGQGKRVTYNDALHANQQIGIALIENDATRLGEAAVNRLMRADGRRRYPTFIRDTFGGIYFTDAENAWLDRVCTNIHALGDRYQRAIAWYALFQAALAKRPYNLFHRRNLYMRTANVARSFGNKRTWDKPFEEHFRAFVAEANDAVIDGAGRCRAVCGDAASVAGDFDLVYIDPPYLNRRGVGVDYAHFYHFLDGMLDYANWPQRVDFASKHRRLAAAPSPWTSAGSIGDAFDAVFERYPRAILAVSYRNDGIPNIEDLVRKLRRHRKRVSVNEYARYQYALSIQRETKEVLVIGE